MQRQTGWFRSVMADLGGPVKAIREASPQGGTTSPASIK